MAHLIETMAYTGEMPWHGLGQVLPDGGTIEEWKKAAGMEWTIKKAPVLFHNNAPKVIKNVSELATFDGQSVLYRSDTEAPLGIVSNKYRPVNPGEVLEFYRDIVGKDGMFTLETAGVLKQGRKLWALARRNTEIKVGKDDLLLPYLLLATSCDGTLSTTAKFTTVRVVCNNTLQMSLDGVGEIRVPHHSTFAAKKVHEQLGLIDTVAEQFEMRATKLAKVNVEEREAAAFFTRVVGTPGQLTAFQADGSMSKTVVELVELFKHSPGSDLKTANGTGWGLVNAVTRFYDHERYSKGGRDNRLNSAWFGKGNQMKARAVNMAVQLAA